MKINKSYIEDPAVVIPQPKSAEPKLNFVSSPNMFANSILNARQSVSDSHVPRTTPQENQTGSMC